MSPTESPSAPVESPVESVPAPAARPQRVSTPDALMDAWSGLALRTGALLREAAAADFESRLRRIDEELFDLVSEAPDGSLLWLVHHNVTHPQNYSALHSLLVAVVCQLAADYLIEVSASTRTSTRLAALSMNLCVTKLQDELVHRQDPLTDAQREAIEGHGARAAAQLRESGVTDLLWLEAIERHHDAPSGALASLSPALQAARLIQQADIFSARLSPRRARKALASNDAAKGIYFDESKTPDEAGAVVIKAVGVYLPGSPVLLRNGEVAVVVRRGAVANQPVVASIASVQGMPLSQPQSRDSRQPEFNVVAGLPPHQLRVRVALAQLLRLTK